MQIGGLTGNHSRQQGRSYFKTVGWQEELFLVMMWMMQAFLLIFVNSTSGERIFHSTCLAQKKIHSSLLSVDHT